MRRPRLWFRVGFVLASILVAGSAWSSKGGITGRSGKQGGSCSSCHDGDGPAPTVVLEGPTSLEAGALALYTFRIETDAAIAGMNAAVSAPDGVMTGDEDAGATVQENGEITHARPIKPDAGAAVFTFSMTAPPYGGTITLYAAGNACNGDGTNQGDRSATTTLEIEVDGPPRPPPPEAGAPSTPTPPPAYDAGSPPTSSDPGPSSAAPPPPEDDSGCSIGWVDRSSVPAGAVLGSLVALAAVARARRRRA